MVAEKNIYPIRDDDDFDFEAFLDNLKPKPDPNLISPTSYPNDSSLNLFMDDEIHLDDNDRVD